LKAQSVNIRKPNIQQKASGVPDSGVRQKVFSGRVGLDRKPANLDQPFHAAAESGIVLYNIDNPFGIIH
jgi:hypothetical protein